MKHGFENLQALAKEFLSVADREHDKVEAYMDGSLKTEDALAYSRAKDAYRAFVKAYDAYYEERHDDCMDRCLAYSVLFGLRS